MNWLQYLNHRLFDVDYVLVKYVRSVQVRRVNKYNNRQYIYPSDYLKSSSDKLFIMPDGRFIPFGPVRIDYEIAKEWYPLTKRMAEVYRGEPF